ncbi:hypothetical protein H6F67_00220 [Microcoleus sp. FACHB-1515]|uniref:hypothetical protein n=1 Tax=Cyanophyceae TaxID=3028117 RepID=UPI001681D1E8|nr:hypothetical protein [Microcoleus sp. FACHB-1515]MBD2088300.1 hypothetical protein [Microcoleus sp. FACHB-1515]
MGRKLDKTKLSLLATQFEEVDEWQTTINLRELVEHLFVQIDAAKRKKASWEAITERLQNAFGESEEIKPATIRQYYYDALKKQSELPTPIESTPQEKKLPKSPRSHKPKQKPSKPEEVIADRSNELESVEQETVEVSSELQSILDRAAASTSSANGRRKWEEPEFNTDDAVRP